MIHDSLSGQHAHASDADRIDVLHAEARYHRERLALYRAKVYSGFITSPARLQELERECEFAEQRLRLARASLKPG